MIETSNSLLKTIKTAAIEAIETTKPTSVIFGKVISVSPIKISLEQKLTIESPFVILPKELTDYNIKIQIDGEIKNIKIFNALKIDDKVILLKVQGGQKYIVLDKM